MTPPRLPSFLRIIDHVPSTMDWFAIDVGDGFLLLCDRRDESTLMVIEAVAGQFGEVIETGSYGSWCGCLLRTPANAQEADGRLRGGYAVATTPTSSDGESGPF